MEQGDLCVFDWDAWQRCVTTGACNRWVGIECDCCYYRVVEYSGRPWVVLVMREDPVGATMVTCYIDGHIVELNSSWLVPVQVVLQDPSVKNTASRSIGAFGHEA